MPFMTVLCLPTQVQPLPKSCRMVGPGGILVTRMRCGVINIQFEGSWLPLTGVLLANYVGA
jgi:hypothetical protein